MTDTSDRIEIPSSATGDSGVVLERVVIDGQPCVRLSVVVAGIANRVALDPRRALGVACALGALAEQAGQAQNALGDVQQATAVGRLN